MITDRSKFQTVMELTMIAGILIWMMSLQGCGVSEAGKQELSGAEKLKTIQELYKGYRKSFPEVAECQAKELVDWKKQDDTVILDVRPEAERAVSMIPGAVASDTFEANPDKYKDRRIVAYCTAGYRSGIYADKLRKDGWDVYNLVGGILAWTHEKQPLVDQKGEPTQRVHVYDRQWDLAADGYKSVW